MEQHRIAIRERSYTEILDLALRVVRTYAGPWALATLAGAVPMILLNYWLLSGRIAGRLEPDDAAFYVFATTFLAIWEAPLATSLVTIFLGKAVFIERPSAAAIARSLLQAIPQMIFYQGIFRFWYLTWPYVSEVILLEQNPWRARRSGTMTTAQRSQLLHRNEAGALLGRALLSFFLGAMLAGALWMSGYYLLKLLVGRLDWEPWMITIGFPVVLWIVLGLFAVVRFLSYLDLRIRREGWEVELAMRAERARLVESQP